MSQKPLPHEPLLSHEHCQACGWKGTGFYPQGLEVDKSECPDCGAFEVVFDD